MPNDPIKAEETRLKMRLAKLGSNHPNWGKPRTEETKHKMSVAAKGKPKSESHKHNLSLAWKTRLWASNETRHKMSLVRKGRKLTQEHIDKIRSANKGKSRTEETCKKISDSKRGTVPSKETREKLSVAGMGRKVSEETKQKLRVANSGKNNGMFGKHHTEKQKMHLSKIFSGRIVSEETKRKQSVASQGHIVSEETKIKIVENRCGGFWYGNVRYGKKIYCELWDENLRMRIREYWGNKSVISKVTKEENGKRKQQLTCHHVYYQEKACCVWDEDVEGYYAMIDGEKHYIDGDPNKFVTLTASENGKVNTNKLEWIKYFEDLIKKQGEKCYYTKEEWIIIKKDK